MKVAPMVWISAALLHREDPEREDFSNREIVDRARQIDAKEAERPGVWQHICTHCVAAKTPNPGRYRYLHETTRGRRRLFREGDPFHPKRNGEPYPQVSDIPEKYRDLLDWYRQEFNQKKPKRGTLPPGAPPEKLFMFMGTLTAEDAAHMKRYVEEWCERIDE